nr:hypothetical protein [uncultured Actinoplanes sp.]
MTRRHLYADLAAVRVLVSDGLGEMQRAVGDLDDRWLNSARNRLRDLDATLVAAAGGLHPLTRTATEVVAGFLVAWGTAATVTAIGFSPAGVIVTTVLVQLLALAGVYVALNRVAARLNARRLERAARPVRPFRVTTHLPGRLVAVPEPLFAARVRLVSAALRQAGSKNWRTPWLARMAVADRSVIRIAQADRQLCQAIDLLEIYLSSRAEEAA